jgi:predicted ATPase
MHIKQIEIVGFKRFTDLKIVELPIAARLIILAGPNGNGKSSLFDAFNTHHHHQLSGLGIRWLEDYHEKKLEIPRPVPAHFERVKIQFQEALEPKQWKKAFYIRSAYRNDADFVSGGLNRTPSALEERRIERLIDNDATVAKNYRRIASLAVAELYGDSNNERTFGDFRAATRTAINDPLHRLLPDLTLTDLGRPLENGTFYFTKGESKNFAYKNLSGGEKAAFDMLLDIVTNKKDFDDSIYAIDEPESHLNPRLHGELLRVLCDIIPESCQLWLATHSIGMLRAARDIAISHPEHVVFLDFDKDFDEAQILRPEPFSRSFWERSLEVAFADMAALIAPRMIIRCESRSRNAAAAGDGFDAQIYERIFNLEHPDVRFVSSGSANDLEKDISLVTAAIEGKIPGLTFKKLFDRDDRSAQEIEDALARGDRVLRRRQIESYLFDEEVLSALAANSGHPELAADTISAKDAALTAAVGRGNPADDMKSASGEAYVAIKKLLGITQGGNNARAFMRDTLAPLLVPGMTAYSEIKDDIFG